MEFLKWLDGQTDRRDDVGWVARLASPHDPAAQQLRDALQRDPDSVIRNFPASKMKQSLLKALEGWRHECKKDCN